MYADAYLAQTDGAYSAACGRRVPSRQKPQALSMTSGLLRRTGSRPCSRPSGSPSCALERNKKDALQRNSGIVLSPSCALERNKKDALQRNSGIVLSPFCVLERNKGGKKFPVQKI